MDLYRRSIALYGRFSPGQRERLQGEITQRRGIVVRDLTRRSDMFVVGALATALIDCGALQTRLRTASERGVPIFGERGFAAAMVAGETIDATLPLSTALAPTSLTQEDARLLAAFDLITIQNDHCRFADASVIRTAAELFDQHHSRAEVVRMLVQARDKAPVGRRKVVIGPTGKGALQWDGGLTTLNGQGFLPLETSQPSVEELFEDAELSEARGDREQASRLYETSAQADRQDPIAPYNLGNIHLLKGEHDAAAIAYQRALARDKNFVEARYNLAIALEAKGKLAQASEELRRALATEPGYPDAMFNLAQLLMKAGDLTEAKAYYERYLATNPPEEWAATARKAVYYCSARLSA